jgi:clan AA aspartic protease
MGDVYLDLTIINDVDPDKQMELQFLADTGATRAWIPEDITKKLGIKPVGKTPMELANGKVHSLPYGLCKFGYQGEVINGTVVIGPKGIEPLAGTHVLQEFRIVVDVTHHTIRRARAMKAKSSVNSEQ